MAKNIYFIETYRMPVGCTSWISPQRSWEMENEDEVYQRWQAIVKEVKRDYPHARMSRTLNRRSVEQAFLDRESSIASREWVLSRRDGKYRVTMYVAKAA